MSPLAAIPGVVRLVHPAPAVTVVALSAALGAILSLQDGRPPLRVELVLTTLAVAGSQIVTGALNDWVDRERDARVQPDKPIPSGSASPNAALGLAAAGAALLLVASIPLGWTAVLLGVAALASAATYNVWLSRTPLSVVPYLVSFGILPLWVAAGVGVPLERVAAAPILVGPFAAAAHLANVLRDFEADRAEGSRNLAQVLGRRTAHAIAVVAALGVGIGVGLALAVGGRPPVAATVIGAVGVAAIIGGAASPRLLWPGMLVAATSWTVAWALATG